MGLRDKPLPCSQAKGKPRLPRTGRKRCQRAYLSSPKMKATMMKTRKKMRATLMLPRTVKTRKQKRDRRGRMFEEQKEKRMKEAKIREMEVMRVKSLKKELSKEDQK